MTTEEFTAKMQEIVKEADTEAAHSKADSLLCQVLEELGYTDGVLLFREMKKWYA